MPFALSLSKGLFNVASNCVETEERGSDPARDSSASMRYLVNEIKGSSEQLAKTRHCVNKRRTVLWRPRWSPRDDSL